MSSPAIALTSPLPQTIEVAQDTALIYTATEAMLLRRGFCCYVTRRVDTHLLSLWKRKAYETFCRWLRPAWRVPPAPPMTRGATLLFAHADLECTHPDDQLHIIPLNWLYAGDELNIGGTCRPRDPSDAARYERLKLLFSDPNPDGYVAELAAQICQLRSDNERLRLKATELREFSVCLTRLDERLQKVLKDLSSA